MSLVCYSVPFNEQKSMYQPPDIDRKKTNQSYIETHCATEVPGGLVVVGVRGVWCRNGVDEWVRRGWGSSIASSKYILDLLVETGIR